MMKTGGSVWHRQTTPDQLSKSGAKEQLEKREPPATTKMLGFLVFSPRRTSLVWVGYDNNTPHGLTGASAAVPVWGNLMNKIEGNESGDFAWPNSVQKRQSKKPSAQQQSQHFPWN